MLKKVLLISLSIAVQPIYAAKPVDLYQASLDSLNQFSLSAQEKVAKRNKAGIATENNALKQINQTQENNQVITRYQQLYKGIPVVGGQVMVTKHNSQGMNANAKPEVNGHLLEEIDLNINPTLSGQEALELAKKDYFSSHPQHATQEDVSELQIRPGNNEELQLVYLVSFKSVSSDDKPVWPFFIIDAQTGAIGKQWNNIKNYLDSGPGGNEKVQEYWYGKDGVPGLEVVQNGDVCLMETPQVKLVNLESAWDWERSKMAAFQYPCNNNTEENVNGAFSPRNDAYFFGHTIVDMYKEWYGLNALQHANGTPMQLIMRVHFGQRYDNAFWDGKTMSFGDGNNFYPLVSLDVAGHEVTHGFTEQHSNLEYHDQTGALNESLSDMAGQASRAYLLEKNPLLYSKAHIQPKEVTWGIGETIVKDAFGKALRFMDYPSSDGSSADCLDKNLAQSQGAHCAISYDDLVSFANAQIADPDDRQNFIVHTASGVFNKAFYLIASKIGIKQAYHMMVIANTKYWTPTTDFKAGACGVLYSAKDLIIDIDTVKSAFGQVGVDITGCSL